MESPCSLKSSWTVHKALMQLASKLFWSKEVHEGRTGRVEGEAQGVEEERKEGRQRHGQRWPKVMRSWLECGNGLQRISGVSEPNALISRVRRHALVRKPVSDRTKVRVASAPPRRRQMRGQ